MNAPGECANITLPTKTMLSATNNKLINGTGKTCKLCHLNVNRRDQKKCDAHNPRVNKNTRTWQQLRSPKQDLRILSRRSFLRAHCHIMVCTIGTAIATSAIKIFHLQHYASARIPPLAFPRLMRSVHCHRRVVKNSSLTQPWWFESKHFSRSWGNASPAPTFRVGLVVLPNIQPSWVHQNV